MMTVLERRAHLHAQPAVGPRVARFGAPLPRVMTRTVVFRPQADDEAVEVRGWHEARRPGLGNEFGAEVDVLPVGLQDQFAIYAYRVAVIDIFAA